MQHAAERMNESNGAPVREWKLEMQMQERVDGHRLINLAEKRFEPLAGKAGDARGIVVAVYGCDLLGSELINFVKDVQARPVRDAKSLQNFFHFRVLLGVVRVRDVSHLQDQCGLLHFLQRSAKRGDEPWRKIANKSNGVGKKDAPVRRQAHGADS